MFFMPLLSRFCSQAVGSGLEPWLCGKVVHNQKHDFTNPLTRRLQWKPCVELQCFRKPSPVPYLVSEQYKFGTLQLSRAGYRWNERPLPDWAVLLPASHRHRHLNHSSTASPGCSPLVFFQNWRRDAYVMGFSCVFTIKWSCIFSLLEVHFWMWAFLHDECQKHLDRTVGSTNAFWPGISSTSKNSPC